MEISKVMVAGAGTLGSQVAWQAAIHGFDVTVYDAFDKGVEAGKRFHSQFADLFLTTRDTSQAQIDQTRARLFYTTDLEEAVRGADIVSESVPEDPEIKKSFYRQLGKVAPSGTIFTTNSSTMVPSEIVSAVDRPASFLALHFANGIWDANVGEVMGHPETDPEVFDQVVEFARAIGMVPIPIHKEQSGYVLNSLLIPLLNAAFDLYMDGVADVETIDKTWMVTNGIKMGPFGFMDIVGTETMYNIAKLAAENSGDERQRARAKWVKERFVDQGKLGVKSGVGFYEYPDPSYAAPDFLKP